MITLRQVEAFKAVMEAGTMLRAAERMGLSQPAVSRLIGDLERSIGYPLFDRRKGRVMPRLEAAPLYAEVERAFVGLASIADAAERIGQSRNGHLRVAMLPIFDSHTLAKAVAEFMADCPDVEISLESRNRNQLLEAVADGHFDVAFCTAPVERNDIDAQVIIRVETLCLVPAAHPLASRDEITPADLQDVDLITPCNPGPGWLDVERALQKAGTRTRGRTTATSAEMGFALVAAGLGVCFGPNPESCREPPPGTRFVPFRPKQHFNIAAIFPTDSPPSGLAARLVEAYAEALKG